MNQLATMYFLDWRGHVINVCFCEYHSYTWELFVEMGWITHSVEQVGHA
jgi:hypothetical protein